MKRILAVVAVLASMFVVGIPAAQAAIIEISINTVVYAPQGSTTLLATANTPAELIGLACPVEAQAENQSSVHRGNDLVVASGDDSIVLLDVERAPGVVTTAGGTLTLGSTVLVSLRMGPDRVFSGGITVTLGNCTQPTTTTTSTSTTTTTTSPTTSSTTTTSTTPGAVLPRIEIEKTASPVEYGADGIGYFTIKVTNPGPVDLIDVHVTDDVALAIDPESDCAQADLPDLAVGESYEYQCSVSNLDGVSPFTNEATSIGTGPDGTEVTDTDDASVVPPVLATTITQPPPTTPPSSVPPTLPVTGASFEQMRIFSISGLLILLAGAALIWGTSLIGRRNEKARAAAMGAVYHEITLKVEPRPRGRILHIRLKPTRHGSRPPAD